MFKHCHYISVAILSGKMALLLSIPSFCCSMAWASEFFEQSPSPGFSHKSNNYSYLGHGIFEPVFVADTVIPASGRLVYRGRLSEGASTAPQKAGSATARSMASCGKGKLWSSPRGLSI